MSQISPDAIAIHNLSFRYSETGSNTLDDLSLKIPPGKIVAVLGPNGAGKTTLLHLLLGFLKPISGEILAAGKPLADYTRREMGRIIGHVPQREAHLLNFTTLEYVLLGRAPYLEPLQMPAEEDLRIAAEAIARLGISDLIDRPIPELSGGEQQIVLVARTLAQDPQIILMDEPTSHLDLSNQNIITRTMADLAASGKTVIFTTHDPNIAAMAADSVLLMTMGKIHSFGTIETVLTRENLSSIYRTPIRVERIDGQLVVFMQRNGQ